MESNFYRPGILPSICRIARNTLLALVPAYLCAAGYSQISTTTNLTPHEPVTNLTTAENTARLQGGDVTGSRIGGQIRGTANGMLSANVSTMISLQGGGGRTGSNAGWQPGRMGQAISDSGFTSSATGVVWKQAGGNARRDARNAVSLERSAEGIPSYSAAGGSGSPTGAAAGPRSAATLSKAAGSPGDAEGLPAHHSSVGLVYSGSKPAGSFPDTTVSAVFANPQNESNVVLFGFSPLLRTNIPEFGSTNLLAPSLSGGGGGGGAQAEAQASLLTRAFTFWKQREFGISSDDVLSDRHGMLNDPIVSQYKRVQRQQQYRQTLGIYGAAVAQRLSDEGLIR